MDERSRLFRQTLEEWERRRWQGRPVKRLQKALLRDYAAAWDGADAALRRDILYFLSVVRPPGGLDIVWGSLRDGRRSVVAPGLTAAFSYASGGVGMVSEEAVSDLVRIARTARSEDMRWMALEVLDRAGAQGLEPALREIAANDVSDGNRLSANVMLMRRGDRAARGAVLAEQRKRPNGFVLADDIWRERKNLYLTTDEERVVRRTISRYVVWLRGRLRDPDENQSTRQMAAGMLSLYARDGFPFEEEDVEAAGQFATRAREVKARVYAVEALAAFGTPQARQWLKELASSGKPAEVADLARRLLRRRKA